MVCLCLRVGWWGYDLMAKSRSYWSSKERCVSGGRRNVGLISTFSWLLGPSYLAGSFIMTILTPGVVEFRGRKTG